MDCGQEIRIVDVFRNTTVRFIAMCHGRFMIIAHTPAHLNGYLLPDWHAVLRELVVLAVPAKLIDRTMTAEAAPGGQYVSFPLTYPLSIKSLADLLNAPPDEVGAQLADWAVEVD